MCFLMGEVPLYMRASTVEELLANMKQRQPTVAPCLGPMVILGEWVFLMSEVPLYSRVRLASQACLRCSLLSSILHNMCEPSPGRPARTLW